MKDRGGGNYRGIRIQDLNSGGGEFKDLFVNADSLDGRTESVDGKEPFYFATVKDETAFATLVYRENCINGFKSSQLKPSKYYKISGKVRNRG